MPLTLDELDIALLNQLQTDASLSNQALAERLNVAPATTLRRVKRLVDEGVIERTITILSPDKLATALLSSDKLVQTKVAGLTALIEITLDKQGEEWLDAFEKRCVREREVQQCYRVSPGPDVMLVVHVGDMQNYAALAQRLFTQDANVRNVKAFFSIKRAKFEPALLLN